MIGHERRGPGMLAALALALTCACVSPVAATAEAQEKAEERLGRLRDTVKKQPESAEAWKELGDHLLAYHYQDEAEAAFRESLRWEPEQAQVHWTLGTIYHGLNNDLRAQTQYEAALEIDPNHTSTLYNLGVLYRLQGRLDDAESLLLRGLAIDGSTAWPLGQVYADQGRWEEAAELFQRSLSSPGGGLNGRARVAAELGRAQMNLRRDVDAIQSLKSALDDLRSLNGHPSFEGRGYAAAPEGLADVEYLLARLFARGGDPDKALDHLHRALSWNPELRQQALHEEDLESVRRLPEAVDLRQD